MSSIEVSQVMKRTVQGTVVSDAMDKTIVVEVVTRTQHPLYKKVVTKTKKFKAHDAENKCSVGDKVIIQESRPISKTKTWVLSQILESKA